MSTKSEFCRVCLTNAEKELVSIFKSKNKEYLPHVIYNISGVKISSRLEEKAQICRKCADAVVEAQEIILRCQETEEYLDSLRMQKAPKDVAPTENTTVVEENPNPLKDDDDLEMIEYDELLESESADEAKLEIEISLDETIAPEEEKQTEQQSKPAAKRKRLTKTHYKTPIFNCEHCAYNTRTGRKLIEHNLAEHQIDDRNIYKCSLCTQSFSWKPTLYRHMQLEHKTMPAEKKYLCNECGRAYTREIHLHEHIKQRHEPRRYKCADPDCQQSFTRAFTLRRHYLAAHTNSTPYHCVECDKYFKIYDLWKYHNEVVHKNETVYCPRCGYPFRFKEKLEEHLEKDVCKRSVIPCNYCQRRFTARNGLREHLRHMHNIV